VNLKFVKNRLGYDKNELFACTKPRGEKENFKIDSRS
jgi:hypothetical protein